MSGETDGGGCILRTAEKADARWRRRLHEQIREFNNQVSRPHREVRVGARSGRSTSGSSQRMGNCWPGSPQTPIGTGGRSTTCGYTSASETAGMAAG